MSLSLTNTNRCALCDPVSIYELQLLCEIQRVSADVFIGGGAAHLSFFDLFPRWRVVLHPAPGIMRNVLSAPSRQGACHSMEGCHKICCSQHRRAAPE